MNTLIAETLSEMHTQDGVTLGQLNKDQPVMLVFLRKFGCIFCMEAMRDIAAQRQAIEDRGVRICLVHMATDEVAEGYFKEYQLEGIDHVSDPDCKYYDKFGLIKGKFNELFGLKVWLRTAELTLKDLSSFRRKQIGDAFQMPGVFLISQGEILERYVHARASDRPDYHMLSECCHT